jgi:hypothetical protein
MKTKDRSKLAIKKMRNPFLIKISFCVLILLFVFDRVANAQEVAPENAPPEDVVPEVTPDEEVPWEEVTKKKIPEEVAPEGDVPEKKIVAEEYIVPNEHTMAMMIVVGTSGDSQTNIPGFACKFKNREYIATNLHVIEDASAITVASLSGNSIGISDQMIVTEEADICLLGIKGSFADLGIVPFEFMDDVPKGSKSGDEVICLGINFSDVVITTTKGKIITLGQSSVETDAPTVQGNSGGPMIHRESGKVIGLVAQAGETTCSGHRVDTVKKWKSITFSEFKKSSLVIANARGNLDNIYNFLTDKPGWRNDKSLATAWDNYEKFLEDKSSKNTKETDGKTTKETDGKTTKETDGKTTKEIEVLGEVDEFAAFTAKISRTKGNGVSQGDYDKARLSVIKALDWKIQAAQDVIKKSTPIGSKQIQAINGLKSDSQKLADAIRKL